ncbi:uncharacterized protein ISCGN_011998 [Ixodes scapularis]
MRGARITFLLVLCVFANSEFPERRPELEPFQNYAQCYPLEGTWVLEYRTHEHDPFFGGSAQCVHGYDVGPFEEGATTIRLKYAPNIERDTTLSFKTPEGFTRTNTFTMTAVEGKYYPTQHAEFSVVYRDCSSCLVIRHLYIDDYPCSVVKKKEHLGIDNLACDFVYASLCGSLKHVVSDTSCPS